MNKSDLNRLSKIEDRIVQIIEDDLKIEYVPIEWDVIPYQKMLEIMAYRIPTNISSWKFGRDYEKQRTIYENLDNNIPYEVIIFSNPARAYLMNTNPFAVQVLVMAHCFGHSAMFKMNKWFSNNRHDIIDLMFNASIRFNEYEKLYGIDKVERTIDAGHSIQWHSSPFETETEEERKKRVFEQKKKIARIEYSKYGDLVKSNKPIGDDEYNRRLWEKIKTTSPVEPIEDILRYIIDNSKILDDWQIDILETLRSEGQYYWPMIKTKTINEGFATFVHQFVMEKLFNEGLLTNDEHGQYNYSNSLVKAKRYVSLNPYHIGCGIFENIRDRWDKGRHGFEYEQCKNKKQKEEWDTKDGKGLDKIREVIRSYTDWFFMQDFLTSELVHELDLYIYQVVDQGNYYDYIVTDHTAEEVRQIIINSYAHSGIPKIEILNGNYNDNGSLYMIHRFAGAPLDKGYAVETMRHICHLWGRPVILETKQDNKDIIFKVEKDDKIGFNVTHSVANPLDQNYFII